MTPLVFLDTETTGLDVNKHDVVEVAWAHAGGPIHALILEHDIKAASPQALSVNGYYARGLDRAQVATDDELDWLERDLDGATIVGSNPAFDARFLEKALGWAPWHYRLVNVAEGAMWLFGWDRPKGLKDVMEALRARGHEIPIPDHTAAGDVAATRAIYDALRAEITPLKETA